MMTRTLRRGSSKDVWTEHDDSGAVFQMYFEFTDRVSVFDVGEIPVQFSGLGRLRCAIAGKIFQVLNSAGISTHYISHDESQARMYVQPVNIPALGIDYGEIAGTNLMPVELLCRLALTKKFIGRIERGEIDRRRIERLLPSHELGQGVRLDPPFVECSTKFEEADRYLEDAEAASLIGIGHRQLLGHYETVERIFKFLYNYFRSNGGFLLMDGKLEAAISMDGCLMIVDSISPDELGLIGSDGKSCDKNPVREWYEKTYPDWKVALDIAKETFPDDKTKWPPYPGVPSSDVINDMIARYQTLAEEIDAI